MTSRRALAGLVLCASTLAGCGPRLQEETVRYEKRSRTLARHVDRYPILRKHLADDLADAARIRALADQVRDPEKKAELVARANRRMDSDLALELDRVQPTVTEIARISRLLLALRLTGTDRERAQQQVRAARRSVTEALRQFSRQEEAEARAALRAARATNRRLSETLEELQAMQRLLEGRLQ